MSSEKQANQEDKPNEQGAQNKNENSGAQAAEPNRPGEEKGKTAERAGQMEKGKSAEAQTNERRAGEAQNSHNEMQNNRQRNAERETHVNPQKVHAEGNANLSNDRAARIADTLMATNRENVNVMSTTSASAPPCPATST
jgi:hypothetical protein